MSDEPDPHNLLLAHVNDHKPPQWVSDAYDFNSDKTGNCFHCHERFIPFIQFGRISKHHCRLCGELVCRSCTGKLHLPPKLEKKAGKTLSRICHACLLSVLVKRVTVDGENHPAVRTRVMKYVWGGVEPSGTQAEKQKLLPRVFYPCEWVNVHDSASCFKCNYITERRHHCRLCGLLFCGDCSQKMTDIPQAFDQKNKAGSNKRVCDYCRFCLARGWRFCHPGETQKSSKANEYKIQSGNAGPLGYDASSPGLTPIGKPSSSAFVSVGVKSTPPPPVVKSTPPPPPVATRALPPPVAPRQPLPTPTPAPAPVAATPSIRPLSQCSVSSCSASASVAGFCSKHDVENSALPKNTPASFEVVIRFRWEEDIASGQQQPWSQVQAPGHADLHAIHNLFTTAHPKLDASQIQYVIRGRAVQKMHWRMFEARFCVPDIQIKKLQPFDHSTMKSSAASSASSSSSSSRPLTGPPAPPPRLHATGGTPVISPVASRSQSPALGAQPTREQLLAQSKPSRAAAHAHSPVVTPAASRRVSPTGTPLLGFSTNSAVGTIPPPLKLGGASGPPPPPPSSSSRAGPPPVSTQPITRPFGSPPLAPTTTTGTKRWPTVQC